MRQAALMALGLYLLACYRASLTGLGVAAAPAGAPALRGLTWLGHWRMFTEKRDHHVDLEARVWSGGTATVVDLGARYPQRWDDGPGYLRDDFYEDPRRLAVLAADLCTLPGAARVELTLLRWPKQPGVAGAPREGLTRRDLAAQDCP